MEMAMQKERERDEWYPTCICHLSLGVEGELLAHDYLQLCARVCVCVLGE